MGNFEQGQPNVRTTLSGSVITFRTHQERQCMNMKAVQATLDRVGSRFKTVVESSLSSWASCAQSAVDKGHKPGTAVAAALVQRLDWQELAFTLPGIGFS